MLIWHLLVSRSKGRDLDGAPLSFIDFITVFKLTLDKKEKRLIVTKRNWYLKGVDRKSFNFGEIRNVHVDEHLILADLQIRVYAGKINCYWFDKNTLRDFERELLHIKSCNTEFDSDTY